ncbi:MAG: hypothetical protein GY772_09580, partial [bacterium]|nr:hypothetical protein [bacterium]
MARGSESSDPDWSDPNPWSALADSGPPREPQPQARPHASMEELHRRVDVMSHDLQARLDRALDGDPSEREARPGSSAGPAVLTPAPALAGARKEPAKESSSGSETGDSGVRNDPQRQHEVPASGQHRKVTVACVNFGNIRRLGEEVYAANLYKLPAILAFVLEVQPDHIQQFTEPADTWQAPTEERPLREPAQGFREKGSSALADESVVRWLASEVKDRCCIMGRASRVKSMRTVQNWRIEDKQGQYSRLLQIEVTWHAPMCGLDKINVAVGHLHNETAKKDNNERRRFFDNVAACCAGGTRILGLDLNMALFGLVPELT